MIIGVIEYISDAGVEPLVIVGTSADDVRRETARITIAHIVDDEVYDIDGEWQAEHPAPDLDDPTAVRAYLDAVHEATTDVWLTLYYPTGGNEQSYRDLRSQASTS